MEEQQALFFIICGIMFLVGYSLLKDIFGTRTDTSALNPPKPPAPPEPDQMARMEPEPPNHTRPVVYYPGPARDDRYYYPDEYRRPPERRNNGHRVDLLLDLMDALERRRGGRNYDDRY